MAKQTALRALEIDNTLAEAYASLAHASMHCFAWAEAETAFKSAIKFNTNHAQAHQWYAFYLLFNAQSDKAISEARRALELHHKFYSAPSRKDDPDGFVSRRLSAAAALAAQRGLPAGVESDYLVVAAAPETLICCPYCLVPLSGDAPICAACLNDPRNDAPVETSPQERIARVRPCPKCATPMPDLAVICATCRTRR